MKNDVVLPRRGLVKAGEPENQVNKYIMPFSFDEIEDVRFIINAKGKHWGIAPKKDRPEAGEQRKYFLKALLRTHDVVVPALVDEKELKALFDELEPEAYKTDFYCYPVKEANQIIRNTLRR